MDCLTVLCLVTKSAGSLLPGHLGTFLQLLPVLERANTAPGEAHSVGAKGGEGFSCFYESAL